MTTKSRALTRRRWPGFRLDLGIVGWLMWHAVATVTVVQVPPSALSLGERR